jgi:hypothetical protein
MVHFTITGDIPYFEGYEFEDACKLQNKLAWDSAVQDFIQTIVDAIPVHTGDTKLAFVSVARKYGASLGPVSMKSDYNWWSKWDHHRTHTWGEVIDYLDVSHSGKVAGFSQFQLDALPDTFAWNERDASNYVKYWVKGKPKPPWTTRETQQEEPWQFLREAKTEMVARLRKDIPIAFNNAIKRALVKARIRR